MQLNEYLPFLYKAIQCSADPTNITNLAEVGNYLRVHGVDFKASGIATLTHLVRKFPDQISLWQRSTENAAPVTMVKWIGDPMDDDPPDAPLAYERPVVAELPVRGPEIRPKDELGQWAYLLNYPMTLGRLASKALPERWSSTSLERYANDRLSTYLRYTFYRLLREDKVLTSDHYGLAAFNTGLVDHRYEPIYAVFEPNTLPGRQPWRLLSFCTAGEDLAGKRLVSVFNPLPEAASYFSSLHDMYYDIDAPAPYVDYRHILVENVDRLPKEFLLRYCDANDDLAEFLRKTPADLGMASELYSQSFADRIRSEDQFVFQLTDKLRKQCRLPSGRCNGTTGTRFPCIIPTEISCPCCCPFR